MQKSTLKNMVFTALCAAIGFVLPQAFHAVPWGGQVFLPMHLPVLLCGLLCGWQWGMGCGVITPLLSHFLFGMPPAPKMPGMLAELMLYGILAGLLYRGFGRRVYVSLGSAMLGGRFAGGLVNALLFLGGGPAYSFKIFLMSAFVTGLPGMVLQLALVPMLVFVLEKSRIVPKPAVSLRAK